MTDFLAHYLYSNKGLQEHAILHIDENTRHITTTPYEKEVANTRFCDGIILVANCQFEENKLLIINEIAQTKPKSLSQLATTLTSISQLQDCLLPPISVLYSLNLNIATQELYLQEIVRL